MPWTAGAVWWLVAAESAEQQLEGVARVTHQHGTAFVTFAWPRPLSRVTWGKSDGRGKMSFFPCGWAFAAWAGAAQATSVIPWGECPTARDTGGRQRAPTLPMKRWLPATHPAWPWATLEAQVSLSQHWTGIG